MARLKLLKGQATWREVSLESDEEVIGRDPRKATIVLTDSSHTVSRAHASIVSGGGRFSIQDHSKSGTSLNGRRLVRNKWYPLDENCLIQICNYVLAFLLDADESADTGTPVQFSDEDSSDFAQFLDLSSSGQNERTVTNAEAKLSAIMELTRKLRPCQSLESLLGTALDTLLVLFSQAARGVVVILEPEGRQPRTTATRHRTADTAQTAVLSAALIENIAEKRAAALSDDNLMIAAPLLGEDEQPLGVILLDGDGSGGMFRIDDLDVLATVSVELAIAVENRLLHEAALRARDLRYELSVANEVQVGLLPDQPPRCKDYEFFDHYAPARQVGGDYYDYIELEDRRLAIVLGDVSGKGIPAALLMSKVANELGILLGAGLPSIDAIQRVNLRLADRNPRGSFVTMVLAILDESSHEVAIVNAGHVPPLLRRASGDVVELGRQHSGFPLGIDSGHRYTEVTFTLAPGQTLVLYSDGITDAQNIEGSRYGVQRLQSLLAQGPHRAGALGERILKSLHDFVGEADQFDDICLLCAGRRSADNQPT